jgi:hypothetical protein
LQRRDFLGEEGPTAFFMAAIVRHHRGLIARQSICQLKLPAAIEAVAGQVHNNISGE